MISQAFTFHNILATRVQRLHVQSEYIGLALPPRAPVRSRRPAWTRVDNPGYLPDTGQPTVRAMLYAGCRAEHPAPKERSLASSAVRWATALCLRAAIALISSAVSRRDLRLPLGCRSPRTTPKARLQKFSKILQTNLRMVVRYLRPYLIKVVRFCLQGVPHA